MRANANEADLARMGGADGHLIEKLLVQGGLRLAAALNAIFAPKEEVGFSGRREGLLNLQWLEELEADE